MVESSSNGAPATAGSREADLENQVKHLREELTFAQETAAAAQGHSKQYESLAKSSDEAVKAMQVILEPAYPLVASGITCHHPRLFNHAPWYQSEKRARDQV